MFFDNNEVFSDGQSLATSAATRSTNILDLMTGTTFPSTNASYTLASNVNLNFGMTATTFGEDLGVGDPKSLPWFIVTAKQAFTTTNAATLAIAIQGAPDPGTGNVSSIVWTTYDQTQPLAASALTANTGIWAVRWPVRPLGTPFPRFISINYGVAAGGFGAGTVFAGVTLSSPDLQQFYPANFIVGP